MVIHTERGDLMVNMMVNNILDRVACDMVRACTGLNGKINIVLDVRNADNQRYNILYESDYILASYYIDVVYENINTANVRLVTHDGTILMELKVRGF